MPVSRPAGAYRPWAGSARPAPARRTPAPPDTALADADRIWTGLPSCARRTDCPVPAIAALWLATGAPARRAAARRGLAALPPRQVCAHDPRALAPARPTPVP